MGINKIRSNMIKNEKEMRKLLPTNTEDKKNLWKKLYNKNKELIIDLNAITFYERKKLRNKNKN